MYLPLLEELIALGHVLKLGDDEYTINVHNDTIQYFFDSVPVSLKYMMKESVLQLSTTLLHFELIRNLNRKVFWCSIDGVFKGLYSTNPSSNMKYALAKLRKSKLK